jgi:hypothetical protein
MKGRKHRGTGGVNDAEADVKDKPEDRNAPNKVASEAEEMKKGGRAKRKFGGKTEMKASGEKAMARADRKPRKAGGRTGSDSNPFTSAKSGKVPAGREVMSESMD